MSAIESPPIESPPTTPPRRDDPKRPSVGITRELNETEHDIWSVCYEIAEMLCAKNRAYGDSALSPVRIFSKASNIEQINVRMDDKLSRLMKGDVNAYGEDVEKDLIGYLILKRIALGRASKRDQVKESEESAVTSRCGTDEEDKSPPFHSSSYR
jgi:hypothetical protein